MGMLIGCGGLSCGSVPGSDPGRGVLRQNGRQGEELSGQVGQVDEQEDEERLDYPNLLGETSDEAEDDSEHQTHQSAPNTDDEEGSCREEEEEREEQEEEKGE